MSGMERRLRVGLALASLGLGARSAAAQWTPALWVDLVQMPVAVARLDVAGLPIDLGLFVPALNVRGVSPTLFLTSLRGISVLEGWDVDGARRVDGPGMGGYVQALHARGLRGQALADAIHEELRDRGVPAGPKRRGTAGYDVLDRDWLPTVVLGRDDERGGVGRGSAGGRGGGANIDRGRSVGRGGGGDVQRGQGPAAGRGRGGGRGPDAPAASQGGRGGRGGGRDAASQGGRGRGGGGPEAKPAAPGRGGPASRGRGP